MYTLRLDADDLLQEPLEPGEPTNVGPADPRSGLGRVSGAWRSLTEALGAAFEGVEPSAPVLIFEPSRVDLRAALLARGHRYVDAGRLIDGRPDPSAARRALADGAVGAVLLQAGDDLPLFSRAPVLVDGRGSPWLPGLGPSAPPGASVLLSLGPRDGLRGPGGIWLAKAETGAAAANARQASPLEGGFARRAWQRFRNQEQVLSALSAAASRAGMEARLRAGFLWLARPGWSGSELREALARRGLVGFAPSHHAYRHQLRITPPPRSVVALAASRLASLR
jgi:hypothetical protein